MTLLPPNSTPLLRAMTSLESQAIDPAISQLYSIKSDPNDDLLLWLVWEYGLETVLPYSSDLRHLIQQGLTWQRIRGTPKSLEMACEWIDLAETQIEQAKPGRHFYEYQLNPPRIPGDQTITNLIKIAQMSAPARSRLSRVFYGLDNRPLGLSQDQFGRYLSDHSGCYFDYDGDSYVKVSFARQSSVTNATQVGQAKSATIRHHGAAACFSQGWQLGAYRLSEETRTHFYGQVQHGCLRSIDLPLQGQTWIGPWQAVNWSSIDYVLASLSHQSELKKLTQVHPVSASYFFEKSELAQVRHRIAQLWQGVNSPEIRVSMQRHHRTFLSIQGRSWIGYWGAYTWKRSGETLIEVQHQRVR